MMNKIFDESIEPYRSALLNHPLYEQLAKIEDLRVFMEHHVFAVWDFMSLLKALQVRLTCVSVPWLSQGDARARRLVNEIVLGEESDVMPSGDAVSHFDLYLQAMREVGADSAKIDQLIALLHLGEPVSAALKQSDASGAVEEFLRHTFTVIERGRPHEIAACFTYGREDLIPEMFNEIVRRLEDRFPGRLTTLRYYLDRHIELDGDEHGAMGRRMVELLCEGSAAKEREAAEAAVKALQARLRLWDGIAEAI